MSRSVGVKPSWLGAMALWAGSDHYSLWQALTMREFNLPIDRISRVYRINFLPVFGMGPRSRYVVAYRSLTRECLVLLDNLPAGLEDFKQNSVSPMGAAQLYLKLVWNEPAAVLSLLLIPLPIFLMILLFLFWMIMVLGSPDFLAIFVNESCDATCVHKVLKIHSIVGALFLMPLALVFLPITLMIFQAPRYRAAFNYRFAQTYCVVVLTVGIFSLGKMMVVFPSYKNYGHFLMSGFGPEAEKFLTSHGLKK